MLNSIYQIKHNTIEAFIEHVKEGVKKGGNPIKTNRHWETIREYFASLYSVETVMGLFNWIEPIIDLEQSSKRAKTFLHSIYVNLCAMIKFHLDAPHSEAYNRQALISYWGHIGQSKAWKHVSVDHFAIRPPNIKKQKSNHVDQRDNATIDIDPRYGIAHNPYDVSDDEDTPAAAPVAPITSGIGGAGAEESDIDPNVSDESNESEEAYIAEISLDIRFALIKMSDLGAQIVTRGLFEAGMTFFSIFWPYRQDTYAILTLTLR